MTNEHEPLSAAETELLRSLGSGVAPRGELERRTLKRLRAEGLVGTGDPGDSGEPTDTWAARWSRGPAGRPYWIAAAAVLAFVFGYFTARPGPEEAARPNTARTFLLLLHQEPGPPLDAAENARRVQEYTAWAIGLGERLVDGAELHDGGRRLHAPGSVPGVPLEPEDSVDFIAGYFLIEADSAQHADEIASTCPHLVYEGWIELREVVVHEGDGTRAPAVERVEPDQPSGDRR